MASEAERLLVVDDDPELLKLLQQALRDAGFHCDKAGDGRDALLQLRQERFDLVVLDWTLPDLDGVEVLRRMRSTGLQTPVLMLTARDQLEERVEALDAGADDYLTKPFELLELQALARPTIQTEQRPADRLSLGDLQINLLSRSVQQGEGLNLSQREFELLCFLVRQPGRFIAEILDGVWVALSWATRTPWTSTSAICAKRWNAPAPDSCCTPCTGWALRRGWVTKPEPQLKISTTTCRIADAQLAFIKATSCCTRAKPGPAPDAGRAHLAESAASPCRVPARGAGPWSQRATPHERRSIQPTLAPSP